MRILHFGRAEDFTAWDKWVAGRVRARDAAMNAAMKAAGLTSPIPGLDQLNGAGNFFPCAPYGTCWQPNADANDYAYPAEIGALHKPGPPTHGPAPVPDLDPLQPVTAELQTTSIQSPLPNQPRGIAAYSPFPCSPNGIQTIYERDPATGQLRPAFAQVNGSDPTVSGYWPAWTVCHAGSWIYRHNRYAWVAGTHRHHHCPVHWVKSGRSVAYVPVHPGDRPGQHPLNLEHGLYVVRNAKDGSVEHVDFSPGQRIQTLETAPREFRSLGFAPLERADAPVLQTHTLYETSVADIGADGRIHLLNPASRNELVFNQHSGRFMLSHQETIANKTHTSVAAFSNRGGSFQPAAFRGGGSSFGRGSSGVGSSGSRSGGGFGGGASHSNGGISSSGGSSSGGGGSAGGGSHK